MFINPRKIDLRWRFDFKDGKASRFGYWNNPGAKDDSVQLINTNNLRIAAIEGKDLLTNKIKTIAECDGEDFCFFRYVARSQVGINLFKKQYKMRTRTRITGLVLVTRDFECTVLDDGSAAKLEPRSEWDKRQNYLAYGR